MQIFSNPMQISKIALFHDFEYILRRNDWLRIAERQGSNLSYGSRPHRCNINDDSGRARTRHCRLCANRFALGQTGNLRFDPHRNILQKTPSLGSFVVCSGGKQSLPPFASHQKRTLMRSLSHSAPEVGIEPTTSSLTARRSTTELLRIPYISI